MATVNEVYRKIKEMSSREMNPRPKIVTAQLAKELELNTKNLLPLLTELKDMRLIKFNETTMLSFNLTLLGSTVERKN